VQAGSGINGAPAYPYLVRDFGNDRRYATVDELMDGLSKHYAGRSVAVHVRRVRTGIVHIFYIDVGLSGRVVESYHGRREVIPQHFAEVAGVGG
jgi:hypothetical protein